MNTMLTCCTIILLVQISSAKFKTELELKNGNRVAFITVITDSSLSRMNKDELANKIFVDKFDSSMITFEIAIRAYERSEPKINLQTNYLDFRANCDISNDIRTTNASALSNIFDIQECFGHRVTFGKTLDGKRYTNPARSETNNNTKDSTGGN